jgi:fructose PTS system EIIA component
MEQYVTANQVFFDQPLASREEAIAFLSAKAEELGFASSGAEVEKAFLAREAEALTGLQDGYAIPHAKCDAISKAAIEVLRLSAPVEWPTFDEQPVDMCIALLIPTAEAGTTHIKLLSNCAVMLMDEDFREKLRSATDAEALAAELNTRLNEA